MNRLREVDEWRRLYECVREICARHGKEDAFGEGDFWVVDDQWAGVGQKIVVTNPQFISRRLVSELSACIGRLGLLGAEIVIALEGQKEGESDGGLVVHSAGYEEYWDIKALRSRHGTSFFT